MARPQKTGLDYFPHDCDASNDEKIDSLRLLYGNNGYAFYFILLERIYRTNNQELDISATETLQILSRKVAVTQEEFGKMLETAINLGCFNKDKYEKEHILTSNGIKKRALPTLEKRQKARELFQKRISATETPPDTQQKPDKGKERKGKESIVKKTKEVFGCWNKICDNKAKSLSQGRKGKIQARLKEPLFADNYENIFTTIKATPFLLGVNDRGWKADFDWIIKNDTNYAKVLEGKYDGTRGRKAEVNDSGTGSDQDDRRTGFAQQESGYGKTINI